MKTLSFNCIQIVISLSFILSCTSASAQWPQWRGPLRDGISKETNLLKVWPAEGPRLIWSVDTVGDGFSSTAIQNNMVYTTGKRDLVEILTALDLKGNLKWQKVFGRASKEKDWPQARCTPTVYKNKVYAISVFGDIACFDSKSGKIIWKEKDFSGEPFVPLVNNNQIYFPGAYKKGGKFCSWNEDLNKRSVIWQDTVSANPLGGAVLLDNKIIVPGNNRGLVCLDLNTGKLLSHYDRISYSTLMVADNMLYCYEDRTGKVYLFRMNGNNLELVSSFKITAGTGPRIAHMSIANGFLFIRHGKVLMAYDLKQQS